MLRVVLVSILIFLFSLLSYSYVKGAYESIPKKQKEEKSTAKDVKVKAFGSKGLEWTIRGETLLAEGKDLTLQRAILETDRERIKTDRAFINRDTLRGYVEGNVEIYGENLYAKVDRAELDLREGKVWGEGSIILRENNTQVEGTGFFVELRPIRVIIKKARVKTE